MMRYHEARTAAPGEKAMQLEDYLDDFPGLSLEKIYAIIAYYLHNQATIDAYVARVNAEYEERMREYDAQEPSPAIKRLRALQGQAEWRNQLQWLPL
jgi:hypothetical protein